MEGRLCAALRRPKDGRYGENPTPAAALLPVAGDHQAVAAGPSGIVPEVARRHRHRIQALHDIRFVEDDWESPTLGAWGLGWECWCRRHGSVAVHLLPSRSRASNARGRRRTDRYGRRAARQCYLQGATASWISTSTPRWRREGHLWRRVPAGRAGIFPAQFRNMPTQRCCSSSQDGRAGLAGNISNWAGKAAATARRHLMALPAYDQCIKASHAFNLLDGARR